MNQFYDVFMLGGVFCSFICSIILFRTKSQVHTNRLLSVVLFLTAWYVLLFLLVLTGRIVQFPYGFKITGHFYFLASPLSFLYIRGIIYNETGFRKTDWIHFILAGLIFLDYIPYLFAAPQDIERLADAVVLDMRTTYKADATVISPFLYYKIRLIQGIVYMFLQWYLIFRRSTIRKYSGYPHLRPIYTWIIVFTVFSSLLYIALQSRNIASLLDLKIDSRLISISIISFCFFSLSIYLFFNPRILYSDYYRESGFSPEAEFDDFSIVPAEDPTPSSSVVAPAGVHKDSSYAMGIAREYMTSDLLASYAEKIEEYVISNKVFLKPGISIHELASGLNIPVRTLSYILNHHYKQRFNDFINNYRISYIVERFDNDDWKNLTFEGLAKEAGFSSRSTFFSVFKKLKGLTPSEYLNQTSKGSEVLNDRI
ncbi:helix-turn-helix domain-containing protein [Arcticibacter tournemirensis]